MPTITLTVGLPGCGKTTWAIEEVRRTRGNSVNLNLDDIRQSMAGKHSQYKFNDQNEAYIRNLQHLAAALAVADRKNIIVSDTNVKPEIVDFWKDFAKENKYTFKTHNFFKIFKEENAEKNYPHEYFYMRDFVTLCKKQNVQRSKVEPDSIIDGMAESWFYSKIILPPKPMNVTELEDAIIVDIDGTLAHMHNRSPYDESKVLSDFCDPEVILSILAEKEYLGRRVIIMSGRHETCREDTIEWLNKFNIPFDELHMRGADDSRSDDVVKYELYMQHVYTKFNVVKVFDDRDRVVVMWRKLLGLKVYQVAEGNF